MGCNFFSCYVDIYDSMLATVRYAAAVILVHYVFNSVANIVLQRPADIIRRKRPLAVWFPYTTIERLLYQLDELIRMGRMVDHCDKLKKMLHDSLQNHLKMVGIMSSSFVLFFSVAWHGCSYQSICFCLSVEGGLR